MPCLIILATLISYRDGIRCQYFVEYVIHVRSCIARNGLADRVKQVNSSLDTLTHSVDARSNWIHTHAPVDPLSYLRHLSNLTNGHHSSH